MAALSGSVPDKILMTNKFPSGKVFNPKYRFKMVLQDLPESFDDK